MDTQYSLTVIVPVYNEASLVLPSTAVIDDFCAQHFNDYEVLIIESGSTDGTGFGTAGEWSLVRAAPTCACSV